MRRRCSYRDHPRSRGNYEVVWQGRRAPLGSPPLARELLFLHFLEIDLCGITPARTGTTRYKKNLRAQRRDHPRSRGNYAETAPLPIVAEGSPPLARELLAVYDCSLIIQRITPARAGTTSLRSIYAAQARDHPRSRGNYVVERLKSRCTVGSPPLARELRF